MPITTATVVELTCSDGVKFTDRAEAELHEAELGLKAVCESCGYSSPSFNRTDLFNLLKEHAPLFGEALRAYLLAESVLRARAAQGGRGTLAAALTDPQS